MFSTGSHAELAALERRLQARLHAELALDVRIVDRRGARRDEQLGGALCVAPALGEQGENLDLAPC